MVSHKCGCPGACPELAEGFAKLNLGFARTPRFVILSDARSAESKDLRFLIVLPQTRVPQVPAGVPFARLTWVFSTVSSS